MIVGPFEQITFGAGQQADLYLLRFGDDGQLESPRTQQQLLDSLDGVTDVFVFSHGWNNLFEGAHETYRKFITGYAEQEQQFGLRQPEGYSPLLVGIIWPSTSFVLPWEQGPDIAGGGPNQGDETQDAQAAEMLHAVTSSMSPHDAAVFTALTTAGPVGPDQAREATELLHQSLLAGPSPDLGTNVPSVDELIEMWQALDAAGSTDSTTTASDVAVDHGTIDDGNRQVTPTDPHAAGWQDLDPRNLLRTASVWKMKDRAGLIGSHGVAPLLGRLLTDSPARVHLIGHSFGARVVLAALSYQPVDRAVHSVLLLQPAINRWCFAAELPTTGQAAGFNPALTRTELPIMATFSPNDVPLTQVFQLVMRESHVGEPDFAAFGDVELYGALGGYGPLGVDRARTEAALAAGADVYDLSPNLQVVALDGGTQIDGHPAIDGHSDINNPVTWWALHCLTGTTERIDAQQ